MSVKLSAMRRGSLSSVDEHWTSRDRICRYTHHQNAICPPRTTDPCASLLKTWRQLSDAYRLNEKTNSEDTDRPRYDFNTDL